MSHLYQQYRALELDGSWIGLEVGNADPWFCTPIGAEIIGWDGAIHYCFVPGFAETVFCVNPENYGGHLVYPIARSFADFLSLLLAVGHTNSLQQVIGWKREEFERFLRQQEEVDYISSPQVQQVLKTITEEIGVVPQPDPFGCFYIFISLSVRKQISIFPSWVPFSTHSDVVPSGRSSPRVS